MTPRSPHGAAARRLRLRAQVLSALLLAAALAGCDHLPGKPTPAERPLRPDQIADFDVLYGANCAGCHGADGRFGAARPLNDAIYLAWKDPAAFAEITAVGVRDTLMPAFSTRAGGMLTDAQIKIVTDGVYARWARPEQTRGLNVPSGLGAAPADVARGAEAYAAYCARCHGPDGSGGRSGGSVVNGSYLALVSAQALRAAVVCGRADLGMPDWRGDPAGGRPMSDQEIADVVAWLQSKRPRFPGQPEPEAEAPLPRIGGAAESRGRARAVAVAERDGAGGVVAAAAQR